NQYSLHHSLELQIYIFHYYLDIHYLHSFPTRRSSDLNEAIRRNITALPMCSAHRETNTMTGNTTPNADDVVILAGARTPQDDDRSEEHTSELQSRFDLVCRLLLEKKKVTTN